MFFFFVKSKIINFQLTFRMEYFWLTAPLHSSIVCNRPSKLRPLVVYFSQKHYHCRLEMCMDGVFEIHDQRDCRVLSPNCLHIATHEMISRGFRRLFINHTTKEFANEHEKSFSIIVIRTKMPVFHVGFCSTLQFFFFLVCQN